MFELLSHEANSLLAINSTSPPRGLSFGASDIVTPEILSGKLSGADIGFVDSDLLTGSKVNEARLKAKNLLKQYASSPGFSSGLGIAFGDNYDLGIAQGIGQEWAKDNFGDLPEIQVLSPGVMGSTNGAFAASTGKIYLSQTFLDNADSGQIRSVILEEIGHWVDAQINSIDAAGDEGKIFARLLQNNSFASGELEVLQQEDDHGSLIIGGVTIGIEKNDSLATAEWLGNLGYTRLDRRGWVGANVPNDFYRFNLTNYSNVDLNLTGLGADVDLYLFDSRGQNILSKSDRSGTSSENINVNLNAGQYYLQVNRWSGDSRNSYYDLSVIVDGAGDSIGAARDIGTLNSPRSYADWVGVRDTNDYYRFSVSGQSNFSLGLTGLRADADVQLLNSSGSVISRSENSYSNAESINTQLGAGTYYVRVYSWNGNSNTQYNLSLNATLVPTGYYRELSLFSENTWDIQSGDNNQFEANPLGGGGDQRGRTDDRIEQIYTDLSNAIFGYRVAMTAGYAYDQSYYNGVLINGRTGWWHAGIDMGATNGANVRAAVGGTVAWTSSDGFVGINSDDGRQWVYGHLQSVSGLSRGQRINAGGTVGRVGALNHLHLEVQNGLAYGGTNGAMRDRNTLLNVTVSPLMAYWQARNR